MGGLQVRVALVLRVAVAIVHCGVDFLAVMPTHDGVRRAVAVVAAFVNVVAGVDDEIEVLIGDAAIGSEVTALEMIAAADAPAQAITAKNSSSPKLISIRPQIQRSHPYQARAALQPRAHGFQGSHDAP